MVVFLDSVSGGNVLFEALLYDGQGAVRRSILYAHRICSDILESI